MQMLTRTLMLIASLVLGAGAVAALDLDTPFESIDGGSFSLSKWRGQPILVVNTASQCAFTGQYEALQNLYDTYRARGLVVVAVPSNDFNQELASEKAVKEFCTLNYGIDMPMSTITHVRGAGAHPFFASLKREERFVPKWNFNKVLIGPDGKAVATYGSVTSPASARMQKDIRALLK